MSTRCSILGLLLALVMLSPLLAIGPGAAPSVEAAGSGYQALTPARLLDTRESSPVLGGGAVDLEVTGVGGVPESGVGAVVLNVTALGATAPTFVTVWPTGESQPVASNLNLVPGEAVPNLVIATVGENGQVSLGNKNGNVDLAVDVMGWFPTGSDYGALNPARLLDTRESSPVPGGSAVDLEVTGVGGVPESGVGAVVLNVTAVDATDPTFVTVWPTGEPQPVASNLNLVPGEAVPNLVIAAVGDAGQVSLGNKNGEVHLAVDVMGWFPGEPGPTPPPPASDLIVFSSDRQGGDDDIFVMRPDGSGVENLTPGRDGDDFQPKWSPDKTRIAFASRAHPDADAKIVVMDADGGNQTVLDTNIADADYPAWSPDSTRIAFSGTPAGEDADTGIYVMDSAGSAAELVVEPLESQDRLIEPEFSPDGTSIGYTAWDWLVIRYRYPDAEAWIHPYPAPSTDQTAGHELDPVAFGEYDDEDMRWFQGFSPDGTEVLFRWEYQNGNTTSYSSDLFTVPVGDPTGEATLLTDLNSADYEYNSSYATDGDTILYSRYPNPVSDKESVGDIWVMDTDGTNPRNLTPDTASNDDWPDS